MKKVLMMLSVAAVFSMALFANAYAGADDYDLFLRPGSTTPSSGGFSSYGPDYHGVPVENPQEQMEGQYGQAPYWEEGQAYRPWLTPGSTTPSSGGFGYYGSGPYTEIEKEEGQMQTNYGEGPNWTEEEGLRLNPGSTTPSSGGFGYY